MREPTPLPSRLQGRGPNLRPLVDRRGSGPGLARFKDVDSDRWLEAINGCLDAGLGLLISATRDGGAISLTVYEGDDRSRSYASDAGELVELLAAVRDRAKSHSA